MANPTHILVKEKDAYKLGEIHWLLASCKTLLNLGKIWAVPNFQLIGAATELALAKTLGFGHNSLSHTFLLQSPHRSAVELYENSKSCLDVSMQVT